MAKKQNSLERFWKELKRRKVIHVITVYAATAFVILELVNMVARPLQLPEWTEAFVIVLLCIGFVISVVVSWIYDVTPAGVRKTKSVKDLAHDDHRLHEASSGWKIATYISAVIIIGLLAFNFVSRRNLHSNISRLEKSIAVLPLVYLSENPDKEYLANGVLDAITGHLSIIEGLRVMPRTSVEQYRENIKSAKQIGKELDVSYLIEGSFLLVNDQAKITIQLVVAEEGKHIFFKEYDRNYRDIFAVQSEVAQTIAREIEVAITPEEKKLIEKIPTGNITAYDLYLKANNYLKEYEKTNDSSFYQNSVDLYKAALLIDPDFAKAYSGLANAYYDKYYYKNYFKESFLDSCLILAEQALSIDDQVDEAYYIKGVYYYENGDIENAIDALDEALTINPNYYWAYSYKGYVLQELKHDYVQSIDNYNKALNLIRGVERPSILRDLGTAYLDVGFIEKAKYYYEEALALDNDSAKYLSSMAWLEMSLENYKESYKLNKKFLKIDSTYMQNIPFLPSGYEYDKEAFIMAKNYAEKMKKLGALNLVNSHRVGYAYWQVGKHNEALNYFNQQIKYGEESIRLGRYIAKKKSAQYDLAGTYAFLGNKTKAYQYLDEFSSENFYPLWWVSIANNDPLFNSIRKEERFQKILKKMESKYQAEHERVRKWLEENDML